MKYVSSTKETNPVTFAVNTTVQFELELSQELVLDIAFIKDSVNPHIGWDELVQCLGDQLMNELAANIKTILASKQK